jgi:hypothetical protein
MILTASILVAFLFNFDAITVEPSEDTTTAYKYSTIQKGGF